MKRLASLLPIIVCLAFIHTDYSQASLPQNAINTQSTNRANQIAAYNFFDQICVFAGCSLPGCDRAPSCGSGQAPANSEDRQILENYLTEIADAPECAVEASNLCTGLSTEKQILGLCIIENHSFLSKECRSAWNEKQSPVFEQLDIASIPVWVPPPWQLPKPSDNGGGGAPAAPNLNY